MARGNQIIVSSHPKGIESECVVSGALLPGICLEILGPTIGVNGRPKMQPAQSAGGDGKPRLIAILEEDKLQGKLITDAYVDGTRGFFYCPIGGEEVNLLLTGEPGTSSTNEFDAGDLLMVDEPTGKFILNSSGAQVPFVVMEEITQTIDTDTLVWCMRTGN